MIDIRKLKELVRLMVSNDLTEIDLRDSEEQVTLRRPGPAAAPQVQYVPMNHYAPPPAASATTAKTESAPASAAVIDDEDADDLSTIASPMVGTFYSTANPEAPSFVKVGDRVDPETVVCLIEAMKIFNEIKAECSGTIERVCVKSGDPVEFGEPLFFVRQDESDG